jgi:Tfp pilus assembly protein PilN
MAQQINLLTPILLAPKRYFSALTLLQATGLLVVAGVAAAVWLQQRDRQQERDHQALLAQYAAQQQQLAAARANLPPPLDVNALQQQLQALEMGNAQRQALLKTLGGDGSRAAGQRHSDFLALLAKTLPEAAWVTEVRYTPGRVELVGGTLDTAVLRPWLGQLAASPLLAGQELSALRVERLGAPAGESGAAPLLAPQRSLEQSRLPVWSFRVVSAPAASNAASGAAR